MQKVVAEVRGVGLSIASSPLARTLHWGCPRGVGGLKVLLLEGHWALQAKGWGRSKAPIPKAGGVGKKFGPETLSTLVDVGHACDS
jgi:hypothetical protein